MNENKEIEKEEINQKESNLEKKPKKQIPVKIKKSIILGIFGVAIFFMIIAFSNSFKKQNNNINKEIAETINVNQNTNQNDIKSETYKELAKEKTKNETLTYQTLANNAETNQEEIKNNTDVNANQYQYQYTPEIIATNIKMEEYYTSMLNEEISSRSSDISFMSDNSENNKDNNKDIENLLKDNFNNKFNELAMTDNTNVNTYNKHRLIDRVSEYEIQAGTVIPGIMLTGTNSDIPGQMIGIVREDVYDSVSGRYLLIPKGTKILGTYDTEISYGQNRILIIWQRLIFPNGKSILLDKFPGVDMSGFAGMTGTVDNHTFETLKAVVLSSIIGATSYIVDGNKKDEKDNIQKVLEKSTAVKGMEVGQKMVEKSMSIKPTIKIKHGERFNIIVNSDLILEPFKR